MRILVSIACAWAMTGCSFSCQVSSKAADSGKSRERAPVVAGACPEETPFDCGVTCAKTQGDCQ